MRKFHRWLVVFFGVFLLWIAGTGVAMQLVDLFGGEDHAPAASAKAAGAAITPAALAHDDDHPAPVEAPKAKRPPDWHHTLQHLHSGETFGPLGTLINTLSGMALLFFAFSGLWMYIRMWSHRRSKDHKPAWFWK